MKYKIAKAPPGSGGPMATVTAFVPRKARLEMDLEVDDFIVLDKCDGGSRELVVADIEGAPAIYLTEEIFRDFSTTEEVKRVAGITLGCDPEFFVVQKSTGDVVRPSVFLKSAGGQIGYDGALMELRPQPSTDCGVVTRNLRELILETRTTLDRSGWGHDLAMLGASCYSGYMAGFHLHFGLPRAMLGYGTGAKKIARLITYLMDGYVGVVCAAIEDDDCKRRCSPAIKYGKPGGFRLDGRTLEYRFPGGFMLRHPLLAEGLLALGAAVVEDGVSRITEYVGDHLDVICESDLLELYPRLPGVEFLFELLCSESAESARLFATEVSAEDVSGMVGYSERCGAIDVLFETLASGRRLGGNLYENWR